MQKILESRIKIIESYKDEGHVRVAALGIFRITLQHACVCLGEWIANTLNEQREKQARYTNVDIKEFYSPADGGLISLLSQLLVAAENIGWRSVGRDYWEQFELANELKLLV